MRKKLFLTCLMVFIFSQSYALSQERISLNALLEEALKNNLQIQAAKQRYEAAKARVAFTRSLADPEISYEYDKITASMDAVMNGNTNPMRTYSISQEIPFPTKLFLRRQSAQREANSFEQQYKETERQVIKQIKDTYFQLFLTDQKIKLTDENLELLGQFLQITNQKYSVNKSSQQDALKAQVEYSKLSNQLVLLEQEKKIAQSLLNSLLNRDEEKLIELPEERSVVHFDEADIVQWAKDNRPELKSYYEMLKKAGIDLNLAKQEYLPDFSIRYTREEIEGNAGSWSGMVGATFPLWFGKQSSFVREARANLKAAQADYKSTENTVVYEAKSALAKFEAAQKLAEMYKTGVLPQAQAALETARLGYQSDRIPFLDLLDAQRSLRDFQMEYYESLANLEMALADLERSVGRDLK